MSTVRCYHCTRVFAAPAPVLATGGNVLCPYCGVSNLVAALPVGVPLVSGRPASTRTPTSAKSGCGAIIAFGMFCVVLSPCVLIMNVCNERGSRTTATAAVPKPTPPLEDPTSEPDVDPAGPEPLLPKPAFHSVDVDYVDCRERGAPKWCRQVEYATRGERVGTLVGVLKSAIPGTVHWCSDDRYIGGIPDTAGVSAANMKKLGAAAITLVPRNHNHARDRYFLVAEGTSFERKWFSLCPLDG